MPSSELGFERSFVTLAQLVFLHTVAIAEFGGSEGVRDRGLLESALARPLSGFGDEQLFATPFARAAALMKALLRNHGFVDGNKRTAVLAAAFQLELEGFQLAATQEDLVETVLAIIERRLSLEQLTEWLEQYSRVLDR